MANKFLPNYIEETQNKYIEQERASPENFIENGRSATLGDDITFNGAKSAPAIVMTRQQRELEVYRQQRQEDARLASVQHGAGNAQDMTEEDAARFREQLLNPDTGYNYYIGQVRQNDPTNRLSEEQVLRTASGMYTVV